jgi:hypothetical protein
MTVNMNKLLLILSFVFFLIATLIDGGVMTFTGSGWVLPAGLASMVLAFIV